MRSGQARVRKGKDLQPADLVEFRLQFLNDFLLAAVALIPVNKRESAHDEALGTDLPRVIHFGYRLPNLDDLIEETIDIGEVGVLGCGGDDRDTPGILHGSEFFPGERKKRRKTRDYCQAEEQYGAPIGEAESEDTAIGMLQSVEALVQPI